jgi:hypothetical protein
MWLHLLDGAVFARKSKHAVISILAGKSGQALRFH